MHLMLQQPFPDDFVIATGKTQSVKVLCELAIGEAGLDYRDYVKLDQAVYRPAEVDLLIGDASKASSVLQWQPSVDFVGLIQEMVQADMRAIASLLKAEPVLHSN